MHRLVFSITRRQMKEGRRTYLFNVRVKARVSDQRLLTVMSIYMLICFRISLVCVCVRVTVLVIHKAIKGRVSSGMCDWAGPCGCVCGWLVGSSTSGNSEEQTMCCSGCRFGPSELSIRKFLQSVGTVHKNNSFRVEHFEIWFLFNSFWIY